MSLKSADQPDFTRVDAAYAPKARHARQAMIVYWVLTWTAAIMGFLPLTALGGVLFLVFGVRRIYLMRRWHAVEQRAFYRAFDRVRRRT